MPPVSILLPCSAIRLISTHQKQSREYAMKTSSSLRVGDREKSYSRLIGEIQHALNQALSEEHAVRGLTKAQIAAILGKNKSFVTRKLSGASNMTLETL